MTPVEIPWKLNKLQQQRWNAAVLLFTKLKDAAIKAKADIWYEGEIVAPEDIEFNG
jgi:hypothetical protein